MTTIKNTNTKKTLDIKLLQVLKNLTPKEYPKVKRFLESPFFNKNKYIKLLFSYIVNNNPEFKKEKIDKVRVFRKIYGAKKPYDLQKLNRLFSDLTKLVEKYFKVQYALEDEEESELILVKAYSKRQSYELFKKKAEHLIKKIKKDNYQDSLYYSQLQQIYEVWNKHPYFNKENNKSDVFESMLKSIDQNYLIQKLKINYEINTYKNVFTIDYTLEEVVKIDIQILDVQYKPYSYGFFIQQLLKLQLNPDKEYLYFNLIKHYEKHVSNFRKSEQSKFTSFFINYANNRCNITKKYTKLDYIKAMALVTKIGIEQGSYSDREKLALPRFINYINLVTFAKQFEEANIFLEKYLKLVEPHIQDYGKHLAKTYIYLNQGKFLNALDQLNILKNLSHPTPNFELTTRMLRARISYELFIQNKLSFTSIESSLNAYGSWLKNHKEKTFPLKKIIPSIEFQKIVKSLINIKNKKKTIQFINKKKQEISSSKTILKEWLLSKIEELEKKI